MNAFLSAISVKCFF